jgi:hypothetical protein
MGANAPGVIRGRFKGNARVPPLRINNLSVWKVNAFAKSFQTES